MPYIGLGQFIILLRAIDQTSQGADAAACLTNARSAAHPGRASDHIPSEECAIVGASLHAAGYSLECCRRTLSLSLRAFSFGERVVHTQVHVNMNVFGLATFVGPLLVGKFISGGWPLACVPRVSRTSIDSPDRWSTAGKRAHGRLDVNGQETGRRQRRRERRR